MYSKKFDKEQRVVLYGCFIVDLTENTYVLQVYLIIDKNEAYFTFIAKKRKALLNISVIW